MSSDHKYTTIFASISLSHKECKEEESAKTDKHQQWEPGRSLDKALVAIEKSPLTNSQHTKPDR